jgi:hypothetical protein
MRSPTHLCKDCGSKIRPKTKAKGSLILEVGLWLLGLIGAVFTLGLTLLIPFVYSIWRLCSKYKGCPECNSINFIPVNSPMAQSWSNQNSTTQAEIPLQSKSSDKTQRYKI